LPRKIRIGIALSETVLAQPFIYYSQSYIHMSVHTPGAVAEAAAERKMKKYECITQLRSGCI